MVLWKTKLWYFGGKYDTVSKLWNFDLLWKKLWYYGKKNYETIVNYSNYSLLLYFYARDSRIELEHALSNLKICLCHNNFICSYEKNRKFNFGII